MKIRGMVIAVIVAVACTNAMAAGVDVDAYIKKDRFNTIKISPTGEYYAATVPLEDKTALAIIRRSDNKLVGKFVLLKNSQVANFWWVSPERVLISMAEKFGALEQPQLTGELYAINADGGAAENLVGQRVVGNGLGSRIHLKKVERVAAYLIDELPADDSNVLVSISAFEDAAFTRAEKMDVYSGHRVTVARAPVRRAKFTTDNQGTVRFAHGANTDNSGKLYYREAEGRDWRLMNDEVADGHDEAALGFSADDKTAYLQVEQASGPDTIVAMDVASGTRKQVLRDDVSDPDRVLYRNGTSTPIGAVFVGGAVHDRFLDETSPEAKLQRSLEAAFPKSAVTVTSQTADGKLALVAVWSDRNPGDYYTFDTATKKAAFLLASREWLEPADMAQTTPVEFKSRDGLQLHGFLTLPHGSTGKGLAAVIVPHGGPFHVADHWGFDNDAQLLAAAGYAVLQVNYRGSGGYGRAFTQAGAREWGGKMQDDLTDATRWLASNGYADASRICIYGASYGGYAALMGVAKEPTLYKCAAGYVGVYDLPMMQGQDGRDSTWAKTWTREWVGETDKIGAVSPNRIAGQIKVPVFLAAGGEDKTAPIEHSKMMEKALRGAGVPVETLYYDTEGHGFYTEEHQREFYTRLLAFLNRNIGGATAATAASASTK